jgi:hypothetical protein
VKTTVETLRDAKALIDTPAKWTQHADARRSNNIPCSYANPDAICFCIVGAVWRASGKPFSKAFHLVHGQAQKEGRHVVQFNDHPDTSHNDVMAFFDRAIALAEGTA